MFKAEPIFQNADLVKGYALAEATGIVGPTELLLVQMLLEPETQSPLTTAKKDKENAGGHCSESECLAALLLALFAARSQGSLCIQLGSVEDAEYLSQWLGQLIALEPARLLPCFQNALGLLHRKHPLFATDEDSYRPLRIEKVGQTFFLYFQIFHEARQLIRQKTRSLLQADAGDFAPQNLAAAFATLAGKSHLALSREQHLACLAALTSSMSLVSGGPGSGKTTVIVYLVQLLLELGLTGKEMAVAAPTGRAAERVREALRQNPEIPPIQCSTLHRLLRYNERQKSYHYREDNPLLFRVVLVDETSMIDLLLLSALMQAIRPGYTRLIFLGDPDQLPSVEAGTVLSDFMDLAGHKKGQERYNADFLDQASKLFPTLSFADLTKDSGLQLATTLKGSHRSVPAIMEAADWIRSGAAGPSPLREIALSPDIWNQSGAFRMADATDTTVLLQTYFQTFFGKSWQAKIQTLSNLDPRNICEHPDLLWLFEQMESCRILTLTHRGPAGLVPVNQAGRHWIQKLLQGWRFPAGSGLPLLITKNNYSLNLFNGDLGLALPCQGQLQAFFRDEDHFRSLRYQNLDEHTDAFAHTVHKSQGSEYRTVVLILPTEETRSLNRDIVYTGLTRARERIFLHGSEEILRKAAARRIVRLSGPPLLVADG